MKHILIIAAVLAACSAVVFGRELGRRVHLKDGRNVVAGTGEVLDFRLTAQRGDDGSVVVNFVAPKGSRVHQAAYLRLEVVKDGKVLLWTKLATRKGDDGSLSAGFQVHDSLAADAFVAIAYEEGGKGRRPILSAYQVPVAEYITDRK